MAVLNGEPGSVPGWRRETIVVMPARNEEATVGEVVAATRRALPGALVLVVDDGSGDATGDRARAAGAETVRHAYGGGYGAALHTGYRFALGHGFRWVAQLDADGQHEPADLPRLLGPLLEDACDIVVGSRFLGGAPPRLSLARRLGIRFFGFLAGLGTRHRITDPTSGFQAFNRRALEVLAADHFPDDFPDADVLLQLSRQGLRIREEGVRMYSRRAGRSMHGGVRSLYYVYKMSLSLALTPLRARRRRTG